MSEAIDPPAHGDLYVISAPSGAGKTSLVRELVERVDKLEVSISHTTRARRSGEVDGVNYFFVDHEKFADMVAANAFLEHAEVFGRRYGTSREWVEQRRAAGIDVVLEIDWQGARDVREAHPECASVFILVPSHATLRSRLENRGSDKPEDIQRRLDEALAECRHFAEFDYLVMNDDFDTALGDLEALVRARRLISGRQRVKYARSLEWIAGCRE